MIEKRGRGRPVVYRGRLAIKIISVIKKHGITNGQIELAINGIAVGISTMRRLAQAQGMKIKRGRRPVKE